MKRLSAHVWPVMSACGTGSDRWFVTRELKRKIEKKRKHTQAHLEILHTGNKASRDTEEDLWLIVASRDDCTKTTKQHGVDKRF